MTYSLKEAADRLGISKNAIKYQTRAYPESMLYKDPATGKMVLTEEGFQELQKRQQVNLKKIILKTEEPIVSSGKTDNEPVEEPHRTSREPVATEEKPITTGFSESKNRQEPVGRTTEEPVVNHSDPALLLALDLLRQQLDEKQRQLEAKDQQIADLTQAIRTQADTIAEVQAALRDAQRLHAGTIQREIEAAATTQDQQPVDAAPVAGDTPPQDQDKKRKPRWISWLFG